MFNVWILLFSSLFFLSPNRNFLDQNLSNNSYRLNVYDVYSCYTRSTGGSLIMGYPRGYNRLQLSMADKQEGQRIQGEKKKKKQSPTLVIAKIGKWRWGWGITEKTKTHNWSYGSSPVLAVKRSQMFCFFDSATSMSGSRSLPSQRMHSRVHDSPRPNTSINRYSNKLFLLIHPTPQGMPCYRRCLCT